MESRIDTKTPTYLARIANRNGAQFYGLVKPRWNTMAYGNLEIPMGVFDPTHPLDAFIVNINRVSLKIPDNSGTEEQCRCIGIPIKKQGDITSYSISGFTLAFSIGWAIQINRGTWNITNRSPIITMDNPSEALQALSTHALSSRIMAEFPNLRIEPVTHEQLQLQFQQWYLPGGTVDYLA